MQKKSCLNQKNILIGVSGSIAARKVILLVQQLKEQGANVNVIVTPSANRLLSEDTKKRIGVENLFSDIFADDVEQMDHITLAKWADVFLIAPASASVLSRLATGLADQLLSLTYLATNAPVMVAPAMNQQMWQQASVQRNVKQIVCDGVRVLGPAYGEQACGDIGFGRMLEPEVLITQLDCFFEPIAAGLNILLTAGPTEEAIDPVRYLSNRSSGKMGYALASAFANRGAKVCLVSGPTQLIPPTVDKFIAVSSAEQMHEAVLDNLYDKNVFVGAAAVADFSATHVANKKIKKASDIIQLDLQRNPDIIAEVRMNNSDIFVVGFALETEDLLENAKQKLLNKKLNMVVANQLGVDNPVFASDDNKVYVIKPQQSLGLTKMSKVQLADELVKIICQSI